MVISLTKAFSAQVQPLGLAHGNDPSEILLSLLRRELKGEHSPFPELKQNYPAWIKMLTNPQTRNQGQAIAQILSDFAQNLICPPDIMIQPLLDEFERTVGKMSPSSLKKSVISLAYLALPPSKKAMAILDSAIKRHAEGFEGTTLTYMVHALTVMDAVNEHHEGADRYPLHYAYRALIKQVDKDEPMQQGHVNILVDSARWFGHETELAYSEENNRKSALENKISQVLAKAGAEPAEPIYIRELRHQIDLRHKYNGKSFHIECDGPTHTIRSNGWLEAHMNGQTILQTGLLRELLQKPLVRIPYTIFEENANNRGYWREMLAQIGNYPGQTCLFLGGHRSPNLEMIGSPDRFGASQSKSQSQTPASDLALSHA